MTSVYLIGSLRNENVPLVGDRLRSSGLEVFDEWYSAGPEADDYFKKYHQARGTSYTEALKGYAAKHIFNFDKHHLDRCDSAVLLYPAGRSGHLELGYMAGQGKQTYILMDEATANDRWDIMLQFATSIHFNVDTLIKELTH